MNKQSVEWKTETLRKAVETLQQAISDDDGGEYLRDAIIQRFEYSFELAWKLVKAMLNEQGVQTQGPKDVLRSAGELSIVGNIDTWLELLEARNLTVHSYSRELAELIATKARQLPGLVKELIDSTQKN